MKDRDTGVAAAKNALPGWLAEIVQVPTDGKESTPPPVTEHTAGVVEFHDTARPDEAVAVSVGEVP